MFRRETAQRIFAREFNESNLSEKGEEERSPRYLITPTGARCNRVFVVGALIEKEDIGIETSYWRARISDPTGVFLVYAGQYQEEASRKLSEIEPPEFVSVIGKPNLYDTMDGATIVSIRPEYINVVDKKTRDLWIMDTARHTMKRIKKMEENPDVEVKNHYYYTDLEDYKEMVREALKSLQFHPYY